MKMIYFNDFALKNVMNNSPEEVRDHLETLFPELKDYRMVVDSSTGDIFFLNISDYWKDLLMHKL